MKKWQLLSVVISLGLLSCKESKKEGSKEGMALSAKPKLALYVTTTAELPTCDESTKTQLAYVEKESVFKHCNGTSWVSVDLKGEKGEAGQTGEKGEKGDVGISKSVTLIAVFDATGRKIGVPLALEQTIPNEGQRISVMLNDGRIVYVNPSDGRIVPDKAYVGNYQFSDSAIDNNSGLGTMIHSESDCRGETRIAFVNNVISLPTKKFLAFYNFTSSGNNYWSFHVPDGLNLGEFKYKSISGIKDNLRACISVINPYYDPYQFSSNSFKTKEYVPLGNLYPFPAPLTLKAE